MPEVTVRVTQEDIKNASRWSCSRCPVARALKRLIDPNVWEFYVIPEHVKFYSGAKECIIPLPRVAIGFIERYDEKAIATPFEFVIDIPAKFLRPEAIPEESRSQ